MRRPYHDYGRNTVDELLMCGASSQPDPAKLLRLCSFGCGERRSNHLGSCKQEICICIFGVDMVMICMHKSAGQHQTLLQVGFGLSL